MVVAVSPDGSIAPGAAGDRAVAARPPAATKTFVHLLVVTGEPLAKIAAVLRELADAPADVRVTVVSGCAVTDDELGLPGIRLERFPRETPLELRRRVPELAGEAEWVLLLEDHNHVDRAWLHQALAAIAAAPGNATTVRGGADNRTSTDAWSWANFLMVLGFHWTPLHEESLEPLLFNVALRRERLPTVRLEVGEFEIRALAALEERPATGDFPVDHVQHRPAPGVFFYHWCNGRVTGAIMSRHHPDGRWHVLHHAQRVAGQRIRQIAEVVRRHPSAARLPPGTVARVAMLSICHAAGALYGSVFGLGDAARHLE